MSKKISLIVLSTFVFQTMATPVFSQAIRTSKRTSSLRSFTNIPASTGATRAVTEILEVKAPIISDATTDEPSVDGGEDLGDSGNIPPVIPTCGKNAVLNATSDGCECSNTDYYEINPANTLECISNGYLETIAELTSNYNVALNNAKNSCGSILGEMNDMMGLSTATTTLSAIGTVAAGAAFTAGLMKAKKDEELLPLEIAAEEERLLQEAIDKAKAEPGKEISFNKQIIISDEDGNISVKNNTKYTDAKNNETQSQINAYFEEEERIKELNQADAKFIEQGASPTKNNTEISEEAKKAIEILQNADESLMATSDEPLTVTIDGQQFYKDENGSIRVKNDDKVLQMNKESLENSINNLALKQQNTSKENLFSEIETLLTVDGTKILSTGQYITSENGKVTLNEELNADIEIIGEPITQSDIDTAIENNKTIETTSKFQDFMGNLGTSENLGNIRSYAMVGAAATSAGSTVTSAINISKAGSVLEKMEQCKTDIYAMNTAKAEMEANLKDSDTTTKNIITKANSIASACSGFDTDNMKSVKGLSIGSTVTSAIGTGTGTAGAITSFMANSDDVRKNNTEAGMKKEKNLNTASNILAGVTTGTSIASTTLGGITISKIKKDLEKAEECSKALN